MPSFDQLLLKILVISPWPEADNYRLDIAERNLTIAKENLMNITDITATDSALFTDAPDSAQFETEVTEQLQAILDDYLTFATPTQLLQLVVDAIANANTDGN